MAGVQDAILQVEMASPNGAPGSSSDMEELVPIGHVQAGDVPQLIYHDTGSDVLPGYWRNWLPFRLTVQSQARGRKGVLAAIRAIIDRHDDDSDLTPEDEWMVDAAKVIWAAQQSRQPSNAIGRMEDEFKHLPVAPTRLNKELIRTHLRLLSRFKGSISGTPDPDNPLMRHWVPFIIQDPLLIQVVMFTSACFLNETGHLPKTVVAAYRGLVFQSLNENLRSKANQVTDAAIHGVSELVLDEWYWGATKDLHAHMKGLKTMVTMRGGFQNLGMHGFISKMILIHDAVMALSHETEPEMYGQPGFEYEDTHQVPFRLSFNSPLNPGWPSFASCAASLSLHPYTAAILDDARALFEAVLALPEGATNEQFAHAQVVAGKVYERVGVMPDNVALQPSQVFRSSPPRDTASDSSSPPDGQKGSPSSDTGVGSPNSSQPGKEPSPAKSNWTDRSSPPADIPDPLYRLVRCVTVIYCRAVRSRVSTSMVCSPGEVHSIWALVWRISLSARRAVVGIYAWAIMAIIPSSHDYAPARFLKTLIVNGFLTIAASNWHVAIDALNAALKFQKVLKGYNTSAGIVSGGEKVVQKHGFAVKEVLQNIATVHRPSQEPESDEEDDEDDPMMART